MNCQQADRCLYDYCDNTLTPEQQILFEEHLADCHSCRQTVDQALLETSILKEEWDTPPLSADFTSRVMERIAAAPIPQTSLSTWNSLSIKRPWIRGFTGIAAVVAVLLMVFYAPGMIKNQNIINIADRGQNTTEVIDNKAIVKSPANKPYDDVLMGDKREVAGNTKEVYPYSANDAQSDSAVANQSAPVITPKNEPIIYDTNDNVISDYGIMKSLDQQNKEETVAAPSVFPVQPANLPASYTMLDKVTGAGSCTYVFGKGINEDQLTIKIAQLPLHTGQSSYSRSYVRPDPSADVNLEVKTIPIMPSGDKVETEKKENADTATTASTHTISYEITHNNQTYLLTITANVSPEELVALSQNLHLQSTTP